MKMIPKFNLHTHTTFCDGANSTEEMVKAAIELGCEGIGFSGHSYIPGETCWTMTEEGTRDYVADVLRVREKYGDKIEILLGIEYDVLSNIDTSVFDYVIGSVHFVSGKKGSIPVDLYKNELERAIAESFGGDVYAFCEDYYNHLSRVDEKTGCDIVGHFDLVMKFNEHGELFDVNNKRYRDMAFSCLDTLAKKDLIFEINTGAISRGYRTLPYPYDFILKRMAEIGAKITLTTDCHSARDILCFYDEAVEYAKSCGVKELYFPKDGEFAPYNI